MKDLKNVESTKSTESNHFGSTLKEFRIKRGLTQEDVSKRLNITQAQLSGYETGKSKANLDTIILISTILKVNPLELIETSLKKSKYFKDCTEDPLTPITKRVSKKKQSKKKVVC